MDSTLPSRCLRTKVFVPIYDIEKNFGEGGGGGVGGWGEGGNFHIEMEVIVVALRRRGGGGGDQVPRRVQK